MSTPLPDPADAGAAQDDFLSHIDVLIITRDEEANLERTLDALDRFPRIVVLDSGSTDATVRIANSRPNVRVCTNPFESHSAQCIFGITHCGLSAPWVLALDADYVLEPGLVEEIAALSPAADVAGYRARFRYVIDGHILRGSLYPPVTILYRREGASYRQDGHAHRLVRAGRILDLRHPARHDDRKSFAVWLASQDRYARLECAHLQNSKWSELKWTDRLRRLAIVTPWLVPLYCLTVRGGVLDGRAGLLYALQRAIAETILSAHLVESAMRGRAR
jgi:glycosyltransferase involved in cell wall biosynthesis